MKKALKSSLGFLCFSSYRETGQVTKFSKHWFAVSKGENNHHLAGVETVSSLLGTPSYLCGSHSGPSHEDTGVVWLESPSSTEVTPLTRLPDGLLGTRMDTTDQHKRRRRVHCSFISKHKPGTCHPPAEVRCMTNITEYSLQLECGQRKIQSSKDW